MRARPALAHYQLDELEDSAEVTVTLSWADNGYEGTATGSLDPAARPRIIGEATLSAVEKILGGQAHFELDAIATTNIGALRVAMAQVRTPEEPYSLVGSAVIHEDDPAKATARAILDAVNRQVDRMLIDTD